MTIFEWLKLPGDEDSEYVIGMSVKKATQNNQALHK
jgi:hypothetical protein